MALLQCSVRSQILGRDVSFNVILPFLDDERGERSTPRRVLYLLHGLGDDHSAWMRETSIERYAEARGFAVIMPAVERSYYTDMRRGPRFFTFVSEELPTICESLLKIPSDPKSRYVAGSSMGGYGAFKLALREPARWAAAASLSGSLDLLTLTEFASDKLPEWELIFGNRDEISRSDDNLLRLVETRVREKTPLPRLYQRCGTDDYLLGSNRSFSARCQQLGVHLDYEENAGAHDWAYWDREIERALDWMGTSYHV